MTNTKLPVDDYILLSLVNTAMRDGEELEDFCAGRGWEIADVCLRLNKIGYKYDEEERAFKPV